MNEETLRKGILEVKKAVIERERKKRIASFSEPPLNTLFIELTRRCNERCEHCGSSCGEGSSPELSLDVLTGFLEGVAENFDPSSMTLALTGGEPLLYPNLIPLMWRAKELGFRMGMTSNGTLVTPARADELVDAGLRTVSVSVDGLRTKHDAFRRKKGAYDLAMGGVGAFIGTRRMKAVQITTIVTRDTVYDLPAMYEEFSGLDLDSWRISNVEPMGRALLHPNLILTPEEYRYMFDFIRDKRNEEIPVLYGCQHWLGLDYELETRNWVWGCGAGSSVASITCEGNFVACLDLPRRPDLVQGNVFDDDFATVWKERYEFFRRDVSDLDPKCGNCSERNYCMGGAFHSRDFDSGEQTMCFKGILF